MIVLGEMHESKLVAAHFQEFGGRLEQAGITLEFALMIAGSQARIVGKEFLLMLDRYETTLCAAVSDNNAASPGTERFQYSIIFETSMGDW